MVTSVNQVILLAYAKRGTQYKLLIIINFSICTKRLHVLSITKNTNLNMVTH